ncbi:MAG: hypothetical protein JST68_19875 [Bacteroidetes bacterium]|nr:hypothetical protein [Bacteroidota bacterium]
MHRHACILLIGFFLSTLLRAQDTLPRFSATARGPGKILISWHNNYPVVTQISIQRSTDSAKNFTTLLTVPDPKLPENGAMDSKAPHPNFYYRLFIVLENGRYLFTPSHRPGTNTEGATTKEKEDDTESLTKMAGARILYIDPSTTRGKTQVKSPSTIRSMPEMELSTTVFVRKGDTLIGRLSGSRIQAFRDSLLKKTKDTLLFIDGDTLQIKPFIPKEVYRTSSYVFTGKYGNIHVSLPGAAQRHYGIKFYDESNKLLFELSEIKDQTLILDKTNFRHSGWFRFELYDGDQIKEKNKFFIPKDF